jgi:hypothetical protein
MSGYLLIAWIAVSGQGHMSRMNWTPVDRFYVTSNDNALDACLRAGAELKVKKFKCVRFYN